MKKLLTREQAKQIADAARVLFEEELRMKADQLLQRAKDGDALPELVRIVKIYDRASEADKFTTQEVPRGRDGSLVSLQEYVHSFKRGEDWWSENFEDIATRASHRLEEWVTEHHYLPHAKRYTIGPNGTLPYLYYRHT